MIAHEKAAGMLDTSGTAQETTQTTDSRIIPFIQKDGNGTATLIARLTLAGHLVHRGSEHDFDVIHRKHGMSYYAQDFAALQSFAERVGVRP